MVGVPLGMWQAIAPVGTAGPGGALGNPLAKVALAGVAAMAAK
jgi:hypothetical protein